MNSMLKPKPSDDPHDIVVVAPDAVRVAPTEDVIASLLQGYRARACRAAVARGAAFVPRRRSRPMPRCHRSTPRFARPPSTMCWSRAAAGRSPGGRYAPSRRCCWRQSSAARRWPGIITPRRRNRSSRSGRRCSPRNRRSRRKKPGLPRRQSWPPPRWMPRVQHRRSRQLRRPAAAEAAAPRPSAPAAAASPDEPQSIEAMARDLASARQEIEQLKASVEQLKASQQQLVAMVSEKAAAQNLRPKKPATTAAAGRRVGARAQAATPPRSAAAPILPPSSAAQPAAAPYGPRQIEPQSRTAAETLNDPELGSMPRPPMPLR